MTLADGPKVVTPLWWCPRQLDEAPEQRAKYELYPSDGHWPDGDEDRSIEGMHVGSRTPGPRQPA